MKKAAVALALLFLTGCSGLDRTTGPDLSTPVGYRQGATVRVEHIAAAVRIANSGCTIGALDQCQQMLKEQESAVLQTPELMPLGGTPLICDGLAHDYYILLNGARDYFSQMKTSAARNDAAFGQTARERLVSFDQSYTAFNRILASNSCR